PSGRQKGPRSPSRRPEGSIEPGGLRGQCGEDLVDGGVGEGPQLVVGAVLDRVRDEDPPHVEADRPHLCGGGVDELGRGAEQRRGTSGQRPFDGRTFTGRVEDTRHAPTSTVIGSEPVDPLAHPAMMAENSPAPPPAWAISSPPGRNFGSVAPSNRAGSPSAIP